MVVSSISLSLNDRTSTVRASDWVSLIYAAFENGINAFDVSGDSPGLIDGLGTALRAVERHLVYVSWRVGTRMGPAGALTRDFSANYLGGVVDAVLARTGIEYLDAVVLDDPRTEEFSPEALDALKVMRARGRAKMLGVAGQDEALDALLSTGAFDLLYLPFSLSAGWIERRRLRAAIDRDMGVVAYDYYPKSFHANAVAGPKAAGWGRTKASPLAGVGTYAFLENTRNWSAEEICLAHVLTEPSLASVQISAERAERIEALAAVPDRDLPPGVSAQVEMARFSIGGDEQKARGA